MKFIPKIAILSVLLSLCCVSTASINTDKLVSFVTRVTARHDMFVAEDFELHPTQVQLYLQESTNYRTLLESPNVSFSLLARYDSVLERHDTYLMKLQDSIDRRVSLRDSQILRTFYPGQ